jgi:hypothetical protein
LCYSAFKSIAKRIVVNRPAGVTVCGILALSEAGEIVASLLFHGNFLCWSSIQMSGLPIAFAAVAIMLFIVAGIGLLALERWGRILSLALGAAYVLVPATELWCGARSFTPLGAVFYYADNIVALLVSGWAVWYLSRHRVRSAFEKSWARVLSLR